MRLGGLKLIVLSILVYVDMKIEATGGYQKSAVLAEGGLRRAPAVMCHSDLNGQYFDAVL